MNISETVCRMYNYDYNMYISTLVPVLGTKVENIKPMHVFGYDDEDLLNLVASLLNDTYLDRDSDFDSFGFKNELHPFTSNYGPAHING